MRHMVGSLRLFRHETGCHLQAGIYGTKAESCVVQSAWTLKQMHNHEAGNFLYNMVVVHLYPLGIQAIFQLFVLKFIRLIRPSIA